MTVLKFTKGFGQNEAGIKLFEDTDSNEQCTETSGKVIMRMLACYEEIPKENRSLSPQS